MNVLMNLFGPPNGGGGGGAKKKGIVLYPSDASLFLKYGIAGFVGFGVYSIAMQLAKRNINPEVEFQDPVESMNCDPIIRDAFINIQSYRELNPWLFKSALQNVDQLLFLEDALLSRKVRPVKSDKIIAFSYFRMGCNRLGQLQWLIKEKLSSEHALTFNLYVRKIYAQLQKHLLNILHLCSEFKPQHLIERAPLEIARILKDLEENRKPEEDSLARWEKMKEKAHHKRRHKHKDTRYKEEDSRKSRSIKSHSKKHVSSGDRLTAPNGSIAPNGSAAGERLVNGSTVGERLTNGSAMISSVLPSTTSLDHSPKVDQSQDPSPPLVNSEPNTGL